MCPRRLVTGLFEGEFHLPQPRRISPLVIGVVLLANRVDEFRVGLAVPLIGVLGYELAAASAFLLFCAGAAWGVGAARRCGPPRLGPLREDVAASRARRICIDHHLVREQSIHQQARQQPCTRW